MVTKTARAFGNLKYLEKARTGKITTMKDTIAIVDFEFITTKDLRAFAKYVDAVAKDHQYSQVELILSVDTEYGCAHLAALGHYPAWHDEE